MRSPLHALLTLVLASALACGPVRDRRDDDDDDAPVPTDAGDDEDAGSDAGDDAGFDAGEHDAGFDAGEQDAGFDAGAQDAGDDGGSDAGPADNSLTGRMPPVPATVSRPDATCSNGRILTVYAATDGDTLALTNRMPPPNETRYESVRLVGVNTPEKWPADNVQCYGPEASARTSQVIAGRTICLMYDPAVTAESNNVDAYGRTLGYVFYGPGWSYFLNAELLWDGFARDLPFTDGAVYETYFRSLKTDARTHERGLWGACY